MLVRSTILLTVLSIIPSALTRHIDRQTEKELEQKRSEIMDENSNSKRQMQHAHLRIHVKPPRTLHVQEGDYKFLECQAGGSPAPFIHWLKNGKRISQSQWSTEHHDVSSDEDENSAGRKIDVSFTTSRLFLDCMTLEDEAEYTCVAENPYMRTSATTQVVVSPSDDNALCTRNVHAQAPRIYTWTKTMIGGQGQETKLICRADGYPRPTITWLGSKEEELGEADVNKYEILSNGDLIIRDLKWTDMGNYMCVAENVHGEAKIEVFLYPAVQDP